MTAYLRSVDPDCESGLFLMIPALLLPEHNLMEKMSFFVFL